jgi:sulfofructose kinase
VCAYNDPALDRDARWLPLPEVAGFDAVLVDVRWPEGARSVMAAAREAKRIVVLDADVGPAETLSDLAPRATHVAYSRPGLEIASGVADAGAGLRRVARPGRVFGVTLGADGFLWLEHGRERRVPAPAVRAVDTLAAGDVWHGAFALGLAEGEDVEFSARFANAAAAIKCSRFGGRSGCPHRAEVVNIV